jgi:hypothetical protein
LLIIYEISKEIISFGFAAIPTNDGITIFPKMPGMAGYFSPEESH